VYIPFLLGILRKRNFCGFWCLWHISWRKWTSDVRVVVGAVICIFCAAVGAAAIKSRCSYGTVNTILKCLLLLVMNKNWNLLLLKSVVLSNTAYHENHYTNIATMYSVYAGTRLLLQVPWYYLQFPCYYRTTGWSRQPLHLSSSTWLLTN
jgi:hypothetical protein